MTPPTEVKRRVIDKTQRMPANIAAAPPVVDTRVFHPAAPVASSAKSEGGKKQPDAPSRSIRIDRAPVQTQVPVQGSSVVNSSIAHALRDSYNAKPGGAEGEVLKKREDGSNELEDAERSQSVIK